MSREKWMEVDKYFDDTFKISDKIMEKILVESEQSGLPAISISPCQGRFLQLLARMHNSQRILEIGTPWWL